MDRSAGYLALAAHKVFQRSIYNWAVLLDVPFGPVDLSLNRWLLDRNPVVDPNFRHEKLSGLLNSTLDCIRDAYVAQKHGDPYLLHNRIPAPIDL